MQNSDTVARERPPFAVQILTIIGYTGFAIPVSIVAMSMFGVLGLALAAFLAWQFTNVVNFGRQPSVEEIVEKLRPQVEETETASSGNASFDRYKEELLNRLEKEQSNFDGFLTRLRDAKDKTEFDSFMADREQAARDRTISDRAAADPA